MFNTMNTIRPRPYPQRGNGNYNAGSDGADKDGHNQQGNERQQQQQQQVLARGRVEDMQQQPVSVRQPIYSPAANAYAQSSNYTTPMQPQMAANYPVQAKQISPLQYQTVQSSYQPIPQQVSQPVPEPKSRTNYALNNNINIAQILKDFRNTMKAIGTPAELEEEVNHYLAIVEEYVKAPQPQINLVKSNLKIAASMLDKYISETLKKESKVVQNWLDALFLQKINYSYNEQEINPTFLVNFNEQNNAKQHTEQQENKEEKDSQTEESAQYIVQNTEQENFSDVEDYIPQTLEEEFTQAQQIISHKPNITIIPQDTRLKSLFSEAKKQAFSNNPQKAMSIFKEAFNRAGELNDTETQSRICLEIGKIYDDNDFVVQALNSYNKSLQYTTDTNVKSRAHYSIAQIYDDVNEVKAALDHYVTSIAYAGKGDDLIGQSDSLTRVANIFTDKYDENNAFEYYDVARRLVEQTADSNMKGYVLSNTADACVQFRKKDKALKYYAEAVKNYEKTNSKEEIAENYKSAAELMIQFNCPNKARSLLKKAMVNAVKTSNEDLVAEINLLLSDVNKVS